MSAILTLIKLQFKAGFSADKSSSVPKALKLFLYAVVALGGLLALVAVYGMVTQQFTQELSREGGTFNLSRQFLTYTIFAFHALQTLFIIPILLKNLDINNERETLLRLPVSRSQIFVSKIIVSYLYELIFTAFIMIPILISFGVFTDATVFYWVLAPIVLIFLPCVPFFISAALLYPIMVALRFLKSKTVLTFLAYPVVIGAIFYVYMQVLTNVAMMMIYSKGMKSLLEEAAPSIINGAKWLVFEDFFARALMGTIGKQLLFLLISVAISGAFACLGVFILSKIFNSTFKNDHRKKFTLKKREDSKTRSTTAAITIREIKNIFRSNNYSFQFFMILTLIPLFVFFCTNIASYTTLLSFRNAGEGASALEYTQGMIFGIALFVTAVMVPLANSFAATNISREAGNIYHTKVIPISYKKQLLIKFFVCLIPTLASLLLSSLMLLIPVQYPQLSVANPVLTLQESFLLFLISGLLSVAFISAGTLLDLKRPLCSAIGNAAGGELTTSTRQVNLIIIFGVILGVLIGVSVIYKAEVVEFLGMDTKPLYVIFASIMAAAGFLTLLLRGEKNYYRLEQ